MPAAQPVQGVLFVPVALSVRPAFVQVSALLLVQQAMSVLFVQSELVCAVLKTETGFGAVGLPSTIGF